MSLTHDDAVRSEVAVIWTMKASSLSPVFSMHSYMIIPLHVPTLWTKRRAANMVK